MARNINGIVEEQIRRWNLEQQKKKSQEGKSFEAERVITVSNALGSNGIPVANKVGELLGIPVYDREIVEHIATTKKVRVETVETLDERAQGTVDDYLMNLFRERNFDQSDYVQGLTRTITSLWAHGSGVFVGRGGAHIISRRFALAVRTVAPYKHRIRRVEDILGLSRADAIRKIERTDAERASFIRKHFAADIDDSLSYDLVINTAGLDVTSSAQLIVEAFKKKFRKE